MRQLGGEIICESAWGEGTTFTFVVKLQQIDSEMIEDKVERIINYTRNIAPPKINIAEECKLQQIEDDSDSNDSE